MNSVRLKNLSWKYKKCIPLQGILVPKLMSPALGCEGINIRKFEFITKTQFL